MCHFSIVFNIFNQGGSCRTFANQYIYFAPDHAKLPFKRGNSSITKLIFFLDLCHKEILCHSLCSAHILVQSTNTDSKTRIISGRQSPWFRSFSILPSCSLILRLSTLQAQIFLKYRTLLGHSSFRTLFSYDIIQYTRYVATSATNQPSLRAILLTHWFSHAQFWIL